MLIPFEDGRRSFGPFDDVGSHFPSVHCLKPTACVTVIGKSKLTRCDDAAIQSL